MTDLSGWNHRSAALRLLAYAAVTVATLAGLFAMHGFPMTMPTTMPMLSSGVVALNPAGTSSAAMATSDSASVVRSGSLTADGDSAATASPTAALMTGSPMAGIHGGCDAEHDGCVANLRGEAHSVSPAPITLTPRVADPASLITDPTRAGPSMRGPPPSQPCLTELCISRT